MAARVRLRAMWVLAGARRADEEDATVLGDEAAGGQVQDQGLRDVGVEAPVEAVQGLELGDASLFEAAGEQAVAATGQLVLHQELPELDVCQLVVDRLLVASGQGLGHAGEAQVAKLAFQVRVHDVHLLGHQGISCAY